MRIRYGAFFVLLFTFCVAPFAGCRAEPDRSRASTISSPPQAEWFAERAEASGLTFVHFNGMSGKFLYPELMAPGVALFDYDNDGDLDVFIVQGRMLGNTPVAEAQPQPPGPLPLQGRLFETISRSCPMDHAR